MTIALPKISVFLTQLPACYPQPMSIIIIVLNS